jgi:hypothetical protein
VDAGSGLTAGDEAGRRRPVIAGRALWPAVGWAAPDPVRRWGLAAAAGGAGEPERPHRGDSGGGAEGARTGHRGAAIGDKALVPSFTRITGLRAG